MYSIFFSDDEILLAIIKIREYSKVTKILVTTKVTKRKNVDYLVTKIMTTDDHIVTT